MARTRHHWVVRLTHWVNVLALGIMVGSGLRIFNAYPAFAPRGGSFCCWPAGLHPVPGWLTFGGWLAGARNWHFAMMWLLFMNGLVYLGFVYLHGEWRDLVPRRGDAHRVGDMLRFYLYLRPDHPRQGKHNTLQKLTYFSFPIIAALAIVTGLAVWKPVQLAALTDLMGGYVWARYWHFLVMLLLLALTAVHVFMVLTVDPWSLRSIVTGGYDPSRSPEARNARPLHWKALAGPREPAATLAPAAAAPRREDGLAPDATAPPREPDPVPGPEPDE